MKISFSTLACPDYSWVDIYSMAKDLGFGGIEIRGLGQDIFAVNARPFTDERLPKTLEKLRSLNLEIPCLASGCGLKYKEDFDKNISEVTQYIVLAKKLGTPYIRVLGDRYPEPQGEVDDDFVAESLKLLGADRPGLWGMPAGGNQRRLYQHRSGCVRCWIQVDQRLCGSPVGYPPPLPLCRGIPRKDRGRTWVLTSNMSTPKTRVMVDGKVQYRMMGEGDLPIDEMLDAALHIGYEGYISLEWVKRWAPELVRRRRRVPPFCELHEPVFRSESTKDSRAVRQQCPHRQICLAKGNAHRPDLPPGAGPHGGGVPRPVCFRYTDAGLYPHLCRVPGRCGHSLPGRSSPWA